MYKGRGGQHVTSFSAVGGEKDVYPTGGEKNEKIPKERLGGIESLPGNRRRWQEGGEEKARSEWDAHGS